LILDAPDEDRRTVDAAQQCEYAEVIDINVTSPEPSARDGTLGTPDAHLLRVVDGLRESTVWSICTAARLPDVLSAVRIVITDAVECSSSDPRALERSMGASRCSIADAGE
jgi:hypothetical protein